jgi:hypothetical protein
LDAIEHFRAILARWPIGSTIEGEDAVDVAALFQMHPEYFVKTGVGVNFFSTTVSQQGTKCFVAIRKDASPEEFSMYRCIRQK